MTIKTITLLSKDEHKKYKPIIPRIEKWWWLRSKSLCCNDADVVNPMGNFYEGGFYINYENVGVRPALKLNLDPSDSMFWYKPEKLVGTKIKFGNYWWTILDSESGELYVLCDEFIAYHRFDPDSNDWDRSELKRWLRTEGLNFITG